MLPPPQWLRQSVKSVSPSPGARLRPLLIQAMKGPKKSANGKPAAVIVFGVDDHDKPRAGVFHGKTADAARKAADQMKLRTLDARTTEAQAIAAKLPTGRLHGNGQGVVPYARRDLYDQIVAIADRTPTPQPAAVEQAVADTADPAALTAPGLPRTWDEIAAGHVVIAQDEDDYPDKGWWEAIVLDRKDDVLTLRWRDYAKVKPFARHVAAVALLNTTTT
jgi:hypothetical protein